MVISTESRKHVLTKKGKCYLCLKSGHLSRNCKSLVKCFKCQGPHHVAMCDSFEDTVSGPEQVENVPNVSTSLYGISTEGPCCCKLQLLKSYIQTMTVVH